VLHSYPDIDVRRALERVHVIDQTEGIARLTEVVQVRLEAGLEAVTRREPRATPEHLALIREAKRIGARLIVIETASRLVEKEDNENFAALIAACGHIAAETGAAVVISPHPTKAAAKENDSSAEGARGGGAFVNNSRTAVSLFPAEPDELSRLNPRSVLFAAEDALVLEHQKGTSSVPKQKPILLVRCGTPYGAVLKLPEEVAADPLQVEAHAQRAEREQRKETVLFVLLYDLVAELLKGGITVSPNKLRDQHRERLGVPKNGRNGVFALVDRALLAPVPVLKVLRRDKGERILSLGLGTHPVTNRPANGAFDARATAGDPEHGQAE
jgi:hypothetical protein